jgi:hypothetical protein
VLFRRDAAPSYDESFVGYGKDRVSFTYELAARGFKLVVQPDIFVVHFKVVQSGVKYAHEPNDWMVGETCWPPFRRRVHRQTGFDAVGTTQPVIDRQVARRYGRRGELEARCVALEEGVCVHPCRPASATFLHGRLVERLSRSNGSAALWLQVHPQLSPSPPRMSACQSPGRGAVARSNAATEPCDTAADHPSVFVVGCDGCASNALSALLELQPGAAMGMPLQGEPWWAGENPSFFSQEDHYTRGLPWYLAHYAGVATRPANGSHVLIDGSKSMLAAPYAAARLRATLAASAPRHRIVLVLHDPVQHAYSLWRGIEELPRNEGLGGLLAAYLGGRNFTHKTLAEAAALERCLGASNRSIATNDWHRCIATQCGWGGCVVGAGLFEPQLHAWRAHYPGSQVLAFTLGELARAPATSLQRLFNFTGVHAPPGLHPLVLQEGVEDGSRAGLAPEGGHGGSSPSNGRRLLAQDGHSSEATKSAGDAVGIDMVERGRPGKRKKRKNNRLGAKSRRDEERRHSAPEHRSSIAEGMAHSDGHHRVQRDSVPNNRQLEAGKAKGSRVRSSGSTSSTTNDAGGGYSGGGGSSDGRSDSSKTPADHYGALGAASAVAHLRGEVAAAIGRGQGAPPLAIRALHSFFARRAAGVRRELKGLGQDLRRWRHDQWLWADHDAPAEEGFGAAGGAQVADGAIVSHYSDTTHVHVHVADANNAADAADLASLPTVFLIGGEKCGSTSLAFAISRHPQLHLARHTLPGEPSYFRKELHFFDDDLRYSRGLGFYSAHFARCAGRVIPARAKYASGKESHWPQLPRKGAEVLLEDTLSGEAVGWDVELNIPTNAHKTVLLLPAGSMTHPVDRGKGCGAQGARCRAFWLIDAASHRLLYLREWVLRAAPLAFDDERKLFLLLPATSRDDDSPASFHLVRARLPIVVLTRPERRHTHMHSVPGPHVTKGRQLVLWRSLLTLRLVVRPCYTHDEPTCKCCCVAGGPHNRPNALLARRCCARSPVPARLAGCMAATTRVSLRMSAVGGCAAAS